MTNTQRRIFEHLFDGRFMRRSINFGGQEIYKVFDDNMSPVGYITATSLGKGSVLLKRDKKGRYTLNLTTVRRQHGNTWIKQTYKARRHEKSLNGDVSGHDQPRRKRVAQGIDQKSAAGKARLKDRLGGNARGGDDASAAKIAEEAQEGPATQP